MSSQIAAMPDRDDLERWNVEAQVVREPSEDLALRLELGCELGRGDLVHLAQVACVVDVLCHLVSRPI